MRCGWDRKARIHCNRQLSELRRIRALRKATLSSALSAANSRPLQYADLAPARRRSDSNATIEFPCLQAIESALRSGVGLLLYHVIVSRLFCIIDRCYRMRFRRLTSRLLRKAMPRMRQLPTDHTVTKRTAFPRQSGASAQWYTADTGIPRPSTAAKPAMSRQRFGNADQTGNHQSQ